MPQDNKNKANYLDVYLHDVNIGRLASAKAKLSFEYTEEYINNPLAKKLSVSLPLIAKKFGHDETEAFFSGLLPDESVRDTLAKYLKLSEKNTFALLKVVGGECAGAVSLYPPNISPNTNVKAEYKVLTDKEAEEILSELYKHPLLAGEHDIRISGAGAQYKLMISFINNKIAIPIKNTPSTHIIKPVIKDIESSVQNEYFCMRLAKLVNLPVPDVQIIWLNKKPYYVIERYDRTNFDGNLIVRLHQEDFCQALNIPPEYKYENEGGPSLKDCFNLLDNRIKNGYMAGINKIKLLQAVIFNFLIGNGDAHGKNFSILYKQDYEELAPFYDLMSTVVYGNPHKAKMAMKLSGKYKFTDIRMRQFDKLVEITGFREQFIGQHVAKLSKQVLDKSHQLLLKFNKEQDTEVKIYSDIVKIIEHNYKQILP